MIFKTSTDINGKVGNHLNENLKNIFNGNFFAPQTFSLSEVLPSSDIETIKAYNTEFDRLKEITKKYNRSVKDTTIANQACKNTMGEASKEVKILQANTNGGKIALDGLTKASKAAELGMKALAIAENMALMWVVSEIVTFIHDLTTASNRLQESAAKLGNEFASTKEDIDDYKTKIEELKNKINDSSTSYDDVVQARKDLLEIQDALIQKYGKEEGAIRNITDAINEQTDALDSLTQKKWNQTVIDFNTDKDKPIKEKLSNALTNMIDGYGSNFERLIDEWENSEITFNLVPLPGKEKEYNDFIKLIQDDFGAEIIKSVDYGTDAITLSGQLEDVYNELLNIRDAAKSLGYNDSLLSSLEEQASKANEKIENYQTLYSQHILNDKIFNNDEYTQAFENITDAYKKWQNAFTSNDDKAIKEAEQNFAEVIQSATDGVKDDSVVKYFKNMYPDLLEVVNSWDFKVKITPTLDDGSDNPDYNKELDKDMKKYLSYFKNDEDLRSFSPTASQDQEKINAYQKLKDVATTNFGNDIDALVDAAVELYNLETQGEQDFIDRINGKEDSDTQGHSKASKDIKSNIDNKTAKDWYNSLASDEDKAIANSDEFVKSLENQKEGLDNGKYSAQNYANALKEVKDAQNAVSNETPTSFKDLISTEDYEDTKKELLELAKAGKLDPDVLASTRKYRDLLSKTGTTAKQAVKIINDMTTDISDSENAMDFSDWQTQLENARSSMSDLQDILDDLNKTDEDTGKKAGELSTSSIDKIISDYPTLLNYMGNATELQKQINILISEQSDVAQNAANMMLEYDSEVYTAILNSTDDVMAGITITVENETKNLTDYLSDAYDIDLRNFKNIAQAKEQINAALIGDMSKGWAKYYGLLADAEGILHVTQNQQDFYSNTPEAIEAQNKLASANQATNRLNAIAGELKDLSGISSNINKVKDPTKTKKDKDKSKNEFSKVFDWIEVKLEKISEKTEKLKKKFEDAFSLKSAKKSFNIASKQILNEINANEKAASIYNKKANSIKLDEKYKKLVDDGKIDASAIQTIRGEAGEKIADNIENYQEYKTKAKECIDTTVELKETYEDLADTMYQKPIDIRDNNLDTIDTKIQLLESKIENAPNAKKRNTYAKQLENLYKKQANEYASSYQHSKSLLSQTKKPIDSVNDKLLKNLSTKDKKTIVNAVKNNKAITSDMIDFSKLSNEAVLAFDRYNSSLENFNQNDSDYKQSIQDKAKNIRENMQTAIDSISDELELLETKYDSIAEDDWQKRNANLDSQKKKTNAYYNLLIKQEVDATKKTKLRVEQHQKINEILKEQIQNIKDYNDNLGSVQSTAKSTRETIQSFYEASGMDSSATRIENYQYKSQMDMNEAMANLTNAGLADLTTLEGQNEYWSYMEKYWSLMAEYNQTQYDMWYESTIQTINDAKDAISREKDELNKSLELNEAKGIKKNETDYTNLINKESEAISKNQEKIDQLKQKQQDYLNIGGSTDSTIYKNMQSEIEECENAINEAKKSQIEYNNAIASLPIERLEKTLSLLDAINNKLSAENDLAQKQGRDLSIEDYQRVMDNQKKIQETMTDKANEAYQNMLKAMADTDGVYGGKTIQEWETDLNSFQSEALKAEDTWIDLKNEMRDDVFWRDYNRKIETLEHKSELLSNIGEIISDKMKTDEDGNLTDLGRASIALDVSNLENSQSQMQSIVSQIQELNSLRDQGYYTEDEYNEKLKELQSNLVSAAKDAMSFRDAIVDIATTMAENELDALNKIIDKRKKALQAKKDYYDYDKTLRDKNKDINSLEAEISAMQGVTDAASKAELARKQAELDELKKDREDTVIEHNYEIRSNGLDELQEDLQAKYDDYIDGIGRNFESIENIVGKAKEMFAYSFNEIGKTIQDLLWKAGVDPNQSGVTFSYITDTAKFATGGIIRSNYNKTDDKLLVRVNPNETILTQAFTDMLPNAVQSMDKFVSLTPYIPPVQKTIGNSSTQIGSLITVEGNVDKTVVGDLKELAKDLAKNTNLLKDSYKYTTAALTKDAKAMGIKRKF